MSEKAAPLSIYRHKLLFSSLEQVPHVLTKNKKLGNFNEMKIRTDKWIQTSISKYFVLVIL